MLAMDSIERVLVVTAHPDDVDFGAAGTVAHFTDAGKQVTYCIVTDGDAGGFDPSIPRDAIGGIRRDEQTKAAACLGVYDLFFLGHPDGYLQATLELRRDIARIIRKVRPQIVLCQSAVRSYERVFASHPDHLAAGEAAIAAVYPDARNEFWMPELMAEGFGPWSVPETWVMAHPETNHVVDITPNIDRKLAALRSHRSQHADPVAMEERVRSWNRVNAEANGLGPDRYAEAFLVVATG
ncbi:MAG: PIG-L deacetylase family protein [Acidimicrobiia bacterium]